MNCAEAQPLLGAYFDSELELTAVLRVEAHLAECAVCTSALADLQGLREELTPEVFHEAGGEELRRLKERVRRQVAPAPKRRLAVPPAAWVAVAAVLAIAVVAPWKWSGRGPDITRELVDNHVRSLAAGHLLDVPSSDQHTVKPWFQGKVDFAPEVTDFADRGFELVGGRLDVLNGRPAAAIVYRRHGHVINVWTTRTAGGDAAPTFSSADGYQIAHWAARGLEHWAATDMNAAELRLFAGYLRGE